MGYVRSSASVAAGAAQEHAAETARRERDIARDTKRERDIARDTKPKPLSCPGCGAAWEPVCSYCRRPNA